eukprot:11169851-Alexandrium_andersonii.AAC.1
MTPVTWGMPPLQGCRVGEASHPGPSSTHRRRIVSANVTSLGGSAETLARLDAHVIAIQEHS